MKWEDIILLLALFFHLVPICNGNRDQGNNGNNAIVYKDLKSALEADPENLNQLAQLRSQTRSFPLLVNISFELHLMPKSHGRFPRNAEAYPDMDTSDRNEIKYCSFLVSDSQVMLSVFTLLPPLQLQFFRMTKGILVVPLVDYFLASVDYSNDIDSPAYNHVILPLYAELTYSPTQLQVEIQSSLTTLASQVFEIASISMGSTHSDGHTTSTMHVLPLVLPFQQFRKANIVIFISLALITLVLSSLVGVVSQLAFKPHSQTSVSHLSLFQFISRGLEIGMRAWNVLTVIGELWALLSNHSYEQQEIFFVKCGLLFLLPLFISILFYTCSRKHNIVRSIILCNRLVFSQSLLLFFAASVPNMIMHPFKTLITFGLHLSPLLACTLLHATILYILHSPKRPLGKWCGVLKNVATIIFSLAIFCISLIWFELCSMLFCFFSTVNL